VSVKVNALYIAFLAYFLAFLKERQAYDSVIACCLCLQNLVWTPCHYRLFHFCSSWLILLIITEWQPCRLMR